jgi:uncharacterized protein (UPF0333 family)
MFTYIKKQLRDEKGATTVEFLLVMPLVVFWFAGTFTFFDAYSTWTRSVKATYTVADVMSRQFSKTEDYEEDMNSLFASIMGENSNDTYVRLSSIKKEDDVLLIDWTEASGLHEGLANNDEIPTGLIPNIMNEEAVIVVESYMDFVPFQDYIGISARTLSKTVVISPRFVSKLEKDY